MVKSQNAQRKGKLGEFVDDPGGFVFVSVGREKKKEEHLFGNYLLQLKQLYIMYVICILYVYIVLFVRMCVHIIQEFSS